MFWKGSTLFFVKMIAIRILTHKALYPLRTIVIRFNSMFTTCIEWIRSTNIYKNLNIELPSNFFSSLHIHIPANLLAWSRSIFQLMLTVQKYRLVRGDDFEWYVSFIIRFHYDNVDKVFIHLQSPEKQDEIWYGCRFRWRTYRYDIFLIQLIDFNYYAFKNYYICTSSFWKLLLVQSKVQKSRKVVIFSKGSNLVP